MHAGKTREYDKLQLDWGLLGRFLMWPLLRLLVNLLNHLSMNHITVLFFLPQQATTTWPFSFAFLDNGFRFLPESDLSEFSLIPLTTNFLVTQIVINESV